ncbi:MAG: hypothetical protein A3F84_09655 [Candidatus Handelsmanbacteria bacterium RIFCSPLOWO2_12_FULL_64_10]|uniref:FIST C-domain domain-containing protein n=1 Tax=Handelsmanbacteria sp. (strain RIFCSPLOWO2_12_FULL_64_10) TaxID=1817868 RepID=A0A1F6CNI8_HANXR|nr:MAG: hypothetical protein A3F84_09655 [Candidatus Handelsmanbacteria bacterium RIFCSPLOWO2_12_FULL_64_10]
MLWASALSQGRTLSDAAAELGDALSEQLGGRRPDLAVAFVSPYFQDAYEELPDLVCDLLSPTVLVGCSAGGVIGGGVEVEQGPALSLTAASLPGVTLHPFHVEAGDLPGLDDEPSAWEETLGVHPRPTPHFILLADPPSDPRDFLMGLDFAYPDSAKVGGLASGSATPGENALFVGREVFSSGAAGVALQGNVRVDTVVAQGCRPIGRPLTITRCEQKYLLLEVDGRKPMEVLTEIYNALSPKDRHLMQHALHVGVASTELQEAFKPGDFLIRSLMGVDQKQGILAVGEELRNGQTIQFHVRDAETAAEDLDLMLSRYRAASRDTSPAGALLFSCQGRGQYLYGRPNHDSDAFAKAMGEIPLGGFFCAGEIGPVAQSTHLHGFTSAFGIFRPFVR